jgi:hypothetical protein
MSALSANRTVYTEPAGPVAHPAPLHRKEFVEHHCGHIVNETVWEDEKKRMAQLVKLQNMPCVECLKGGMRGKK